MFYQIGIIVTFFLAAILISKRGKTKADWILLAWLILIGFHLASYYFFFTGGKISYPSLLGFQMPFPLFHGPFLYWYTQTLTNQPVRYWWIHFVPALVIYVLLTPFLLSPAEEKIYVYQHAGAGHETFVYVVFTLIVISGLLYVFLSLRSLQKHRQLIRDQFSHAEKINLLWLRYLIYSIGTIWMAVILNSSVMVYSLVVVFVFFLGYFGINQVGIFTQKAPPESPDLTPDKVLTNPISAEEVSSPEIEPRKEKYMKSGLSEEAATAIYTRLKQSMEEKKWYLNPEITLAELAQALNVHPNNLSQVINTLEGKNFYDYINHLRIDEFKKRVILPENQKYTLLALAHDCGFNSKVSFNRNFKNATRLTPSHYLKNLHVNLKD